MADAAMGERTRGVGTAAPVAIARDAMLRDVLEGLRATPKVLSPKYFYDTRGSELFERITRLEAYYLTRAERALLERWIPGWVDELRPAALLELGAGSADKSRVVLDAMARTGSGSLYVPVDVSGEFLHETAEQLRAEYAGLRVAPEVADMTDRLDLSVTLPDPSWIALLGSTIGNFGPRAAVRLLCRIASLMGIEDRFLMGVDLRPGALKSVERLEAAYNDAEGVTADFNLNVLRVLNRELGADFDLGAFRHRAFYDADLGRIEMHLVADARQSVALNGERIEVAAGESIRTEISCKYDRATVEALFSDAGLALDRWVEGDDALFALALARRER